VTPIWPARPTLKGNPKNHGPDPRGKGLWFAYQKKRKKREQSAAFVLKTKSTGEWQEPHCATLKSCSQLVTQPSGHGNAPEEAMGRGLPLGKRAPRFHRRLERGREPFLNSLQKSRTDSGEELGAMPSGYSRREQGTVVRKCPPICFEQPRPLWETRSTENGHSVMMKRKKAACSLEKDDRKGKKKRHHHPGPNGN